MKRLILLAALAAVIAPTLSACENTIRGVGRDTAETVDATGDAVRRVAE